MCTFVNLAEEPLTDFLHVRDAVTVQMLDQDRLFDLFFGQVRRRVNGVESVAVFVDNVLEQWHDTRLSAQYT